MANGDDAPARLAQLALIEMKKAATRDIHFLGLATPLRHRPTADQVADISEGEIRSAMVFVGPYAEAGEPWATTLLGNARQVLEVKNPRMAGLYLDETGKGHPADRAVARAGVRYNAGEKPGGLLGDGVNVSRTAAATRSPVAKTAEAATTRVR